eukprot:jgi/Ulvmu1/11617/UM008_0018.1
MDATGLEEDFSRFREEAVNGALELIFKGVWHQADLLEQQRSTRLAVARECLEAAYSVIDMAYPSRQKAPVTPISMIHGSWEPDKEPERPALERWATGYLGWMASRGSMTAAVGGRIETGSPPITPEPGIASSRLSSRPVSPSVWPPTEAVGLPNLEETIPLPCDSFVPPQTDSTFEARLREDLALRQEQKASRDAILQHDSAEREKLAAMRAKMRGRTYAYDHQGQVVLVTPIDPKRLPRPMTPIVRVTSSRGRRSAAGGSGLTGGAGVGGQAVPAAAAVPAAKPKGKHNGRKGPTQTDYIERPRPNVPSPLDNIQLEAGVSLKGPDGTRTGPRPKKDPANMSRAEFVAYAAKKNRTSKAAAAMLPRAGTGTRQSSSGTDGSGTEVGAKAAGGPARVAGAAQQDQVARSVSRVAGGGAGAATGARAAASTAQERKHDTDGHSGTSGRGGRSTGGSAGAGGGRASAAGGGEVPAAVAGAAGVRGAGKGAAKKAAGALQPQSRGTRPAREPGLKGPLRRRTEDLPHWIQQGTLKPRSAPGMNNGAPGMRKAAGSGAASRKLPPIGVPTPGMPVTRPTLEKIAGTIGRTDRLPRSRAEKPTCAPPRSRGSSPARQGAVDEAASPALAET